MSNESLNIIHWKFVTFIMLLMATVLLSYADSSSPVLAMFGTLIGVLGRDLFRKETQSQGGDNVQGNTK